MTSVLMAPPVTAQLEPVDIASVASIPLETFQPPLGTDRFNSQPWQPSTALAQAGVTQQRLGLSEADRLRQQGIDHAKAGELEQALVVWQEAIELYRQASDRLGEAHSYRNLGRAYGLLNQAQASLESYQQALALDRQLGNKEERELTLDGLGRSYQALKQYEPAIEAFEQAFVLSKGTGNRKRQGYYLAKLGNLHRLVGQYDLALEQLEQSLALRRETGSRLGESYVLAQLGAVSQSLGQFQTAIAYFEQSLAVERDIGAHGEAAESLNSLATVYQSLGQYRQAISFLQESLAIAREHHNPAAEAVALGNLAIAHRSLGEYRHAIELHQQSLAIEQERGDVLGMAHSFNSLGAVYDALGQYGQAIRFFEQSLAIGQSLGDRRGQANALGNLGNTYQALGQYSKALELHEQSLDLQRDLGHRQGEASALANLGNVYQSLSQYDRAIELLSSALSLEQALGNPQGQANSLVNLGNVYDARGETEQSLTLYQQALVLQREMGDRQGEAASLTNLSNAYYGLSQFERSIQLLEQSLAIKRDLGDRAGEAIALGNLGAVYTVLGQYERALRLYQQSLAIDQDLGRRRGEAASLINIANAHDALEQYEQAVAVHRQAIALNQSIGNLQGEATSLSNLGNSYQALGQTEQSLQAQQQALALMREVGDRRGEATVLVNLGAVLSRLDASPETIVQRFQQALGLAEEVGDRQIAAKSLSALGTLANKQGQPDLAIAFLKHSVDLSEAIRADLQGLETNLQQSYTDTVANRYRFLANLLLEQGRIPEAQQVLDLLKLEELREFSQTTRATWTSEGLQYTAAEQLVIEAHGDLVAFGTTLYDCEQNDCADLNELQKQQSQLLAEYDEQVTRFEATLQENEERDRLFNNPNNLSVEAQELLAANPNSVLIYPLVTEDKLWLLYATAGGQAGGTVGTVELDVSQAELSTTVQQLGKLLSGERRLTQLQSTSQQLHRWLIEPLAAVLEQNEIEHLIFVNDRVTRYIPMAVLFDGEQYLLERYTLSTVLSPALTDTEPQLGWTDRTNILGLGLTQAVPGFSSLPAVATELDSIVLSDQADDRGVYPGQVFLDDAFDLETLQANVGAHQVLHIATHANFVPGRPDASYIVLGTGEHWRIPEIDQLGEQLRNLHLVVLSACQTALGGKAEDGTEIAGLSAYFLAEGRAESVIASLWSVSDNSTSLLMERFYELMASGELTKAEALREAQLSLLYDQNVATRLEQTRRGFQFKPAESASETAPISETTGLAHPYYWAPFIVIGNAQ